MKMLNRLLSHDLPRSRWLALILMLIVIGLAIENLFFRTVENRTVRRWGMQT